LNKWKNYFCQLSNMMMGGQMLTVEPLVPEPTSFKSHDSLVSIVLSYGLDNQGSRVRFLAGAGNSSVHQCIQNSSGAHPASSKWVPGALSLVVKQPGHEADHSPPSIAKVKECMELYLHLRKGTGTTLPLPTSFKVEVVIE
jgi:hypothetical protein